MRNRLSRNRQTNPEPETDIETETNEEELDTNALLKMKEELEAKQSRIANLQGRIETHLSQLKKEFNCDSVEQAEKILQEKKKLVSAKRKQLADDISNLLESYDWDFANGN